MKYIDLHCDTLHRATLDNSDFYNSEYHIDFNRAKSFEKFQQLMAIWIPDNLIGYDRTRMFIDSVNRYNSIKNQDDTIKTFLSVENLSMLNGKISNFHLLTDNDIKLATLTWNEDNELGSGALSKSKTGITNFGIEVVKLMRENNIVLDVSHASDYLFYDIAEICEYPIVASHSNSRRITNVKRNLSDEMFEIIKEKHGLVGLNLYRGFLNENEYSASINDVLKHAYRFLELGGEDVLCFGADFDGADMPDDIKGIQDIDKIYSEFTRYFGENVANKIFFENASKFFDFFD